MKSKKGADLHFDFTIVRNVMYLYSKKAQEHYLKFPIETFFLAKFAESKEGKEFIRNKPDNNSQKIERILNDTSLLKEQAVNALKSCPAQSKKMCEFLIG